MIPARYDKGMDLRQLQCFVAVAEELHFGRAAFRLHMAQPSLSRHVQRLERELGVVLFERSRRSVELTALGARFLPEARKALEQVERAAAMARTAQDGRTGRVRLGFVSSAVADVMPRLVRAHRESYLEIEWTLGAMTSLEQVAALRAGRLDAGLLRPPDDWADIALLPLAAERLCALVPDGHPLAGQRHLQLRDLRGWPLVLYPRADGPAVLDHIIEACRAVGFRPQIAQECGDFHATLGLVAAGAGIALVIGTAYALTIPGVGLYPLEDPLPVWTLALAWRQGDSSPVLARLRATAQAV